MQTPPSLMLNTLFSKLQDFIGYSLSDRRFMVMESGGLFVIQALYKVFNFVTVLILSHLLTKSIYGEYALVMSWVTVISTLITLGLPRLMAREIARFHISKEWQRLNGFVRSSFLYVCVISAGASLVMWGIIKAILPSGSTLQMAFLMGIAMVFLYSMVRLEQSTMEGIKYISLGRIPDNSIQPLVFIVTLLVLSHFSYGLTSANAVGLYAFTTLLMSIGIGAVLIRNKMPAEVFRSPPIYPTKLLSQSLPFLVMNFANVLDTRMSTLILGWLSDTGSVAVYNVITRGTDLISFGLFAFSAPVARIILQRYLENNHKGMQRVLSRTTKLLTLLALPLVLFFFALGHWYLSLFGKGYVEGYIPLIIIAAGELVNVASGMVSVFLYQIKYEKIVSNVIIASLVFNFIVGVYAVPRYGVLGAAIAEALSMVFRNVILSIIAYKKTGINTTAFS
jgi:O-antigen/teichoic acid export membrane protein